MDQSHFQIGRLFKRLCLRCICIFTELAFMTVIRLDGDAFGRRIGIHVVLLLSLSDGAAVKEEEGRNKLAANTIIKLSQFVLGISQEQ